jgi:ABC-type glycerol-3-phosphate transport system substrate-binding protein
MNRTSIRVTGIIAMAILVMACGSRGGGDATTQPSADGGQTGASASAGASAGLTGTLDVWTQPQGDEERAIKAIGAAFEEANPGVEFKLLVSSEDTYATKVNTALQAKAPPDIAALEDRTWMQAGKVVQLDDKLVEWGVDVTDFNPGGIGRGTPKGTLESGLYGVGEFLGGNILVYNKALLDAAGIAHPPADRSLTIDEYDALCRAVAKPDPDPNKAIFGCSMPEWGITIQAKDVFGADGRSAIGNMNSPEMVHAFDVAAGLIRDKMAPSPQLLEAASESDMFASGRLGITWSDFTETPKYLENAVDFGIAPFYVINDGENFVDTWTSPWGTFVDSEDQALALEFLKFIATDAQRIRPTVSADPPLSMTVAAEIGYGTDDPVKAAYLEVLESAAKPQVFVPPGVEAWDPAEVMRLLVDEGRTDTQAILDAQAQASQPELDEAWERFDDIEG